MRNDARIIYVRCGDVGSNDGHAIIVTEYIYMKEQREKMSNSPTVIFKAEAGAASKSRHRVLGFASATRSSHHLFGVFDNLNNSVFWPQSFKNRSKECEVAEPKWKHVVCFWRVL